MHTQVPHTVPVMEGLCTRLEKSSAMHLSSHHQKCKPPRKLALLSNLGKKVFKKSIEKETSLTTGFSKWCELFLGVVQAFSLRSLFVFIKLILYKRAFEACDLHFTIFKKLEKRTKFRNILLDCGKQLY